MAADASSGAKKFLSDNSPKLFIHAYDRIGKEFLDAHHAKSLKLEFYVDDASVGSLEVIAREPRRPGKDSSELITPKIVQTVSLSSSPKGSAARRELKLRVSGTVGAKKIEATQTLSLQESRSEYVFVDPVADPEAGYAKPSLRLTVQHRPFEWQ